MICAEIIKSYNEDAHAEANSNDGANSYEEIKTILTIFNEKEATFKA